MSLRQIDKVTSVDGVLEWAQRASDRFNEAMRVSILGGQLLKNVTPNADGALTTVPHKLGRRPSGWFVAGTSFSGVEEDVLDVAVSGTVTSSHSLGAIPLDYQFFAVAIQANNNFSAGDIIILDAVNTDIGGARGVLASPTATDVYFRVGANGIAGFDRTAGTVFTLGVADWDVYCRVRRPRSLHDYTNRQVGSDATKYLYLRDYGATGSDKYNLWVF